MALKLNEAYPGRFNNPSPEYPQGSFKNRTTPTAEDGSYFEQQWANDHLAFLSSLLDGAGVEANGSVDQVGASQYYDALLQVIASQNADAINAPIATVAAAGTINLTTGAPNTSQLAISGSGVSINGFTVAANRFFVVKMTGATNTLVNSASLVTGRDANIPIVAGDSFLMRSTAANTVEILGFVENPSPRASLTVSGYQKLPSGLIIQWGTTAVIGDGVAILVSLPLTFPNSTLWVGASNNVDVSGDTTAARTSGAQIISASQIRVSQNSTNGSSNAISWLAIGF